MKRVLLLLLFVAGCGTAGDAPPPQAQAPAEDPAAARVYGAECTSCHGAGGRGDGPMATQLGVRPRDYTDPAWQASVTDEQIAQSIVQGKAPAMPQHPDLADKPDVLKALVAKIRGFRR